MAGEGRSYEKRSILQRNDIRHRRDIKVLSRTERSISATVFTMSHFATTESRFLSTSILTASTTAADLSGIDFPYTREQLLEIITDLISRLDDRSDVLIYWQASRGTAPRNHPFREFQGESANVRKA